MKKVLIYLLSIILLASCDTDTKAIKVRTLPKEITTIPNGDIVITPVNKNVWIRSKTFMGGIIMNKSVEGYSNSYTPTLSEVMKAEDILIKCLYTDKIGTDSININVNLLGSTPKYIRQYFGRINKKGERTISMNFIHISVLHMFNEEGVNYWQEMKIEGINEIPGGNDFFQILINLDTKCCSGFSINGNG